MIRNKFYKLTIFILISVLLFISCSPKLGSSFYNTPEDILFQHFSSYMPRGYNVGMASVNYPGVLAIVGDELIFDAQGVGSRPWLNHISPFKISKKSITKIEISDEKAFKRKIIIIKTANLEYPFYMADADTIYGKILNWYSN